MGKSGSLDDESILQYYEGSFGNYSLNTLLCAGTVYSKFDFTGGKNNSEDSELC